MKGIKSNKNWRKKTKLKEKNSCSKQMKFRGFAKLIYGIKSKMKKLSKDSKELLRKQIN